jgi:hypothetical protein
MKGAKVILNKKNKAFSWSPSAISDYINCPRQYAARRFYCTLPWVETEAMRAGTIEHHHLEMRLKEKTPLPSGFARGEKYCKAFEDSEGIIIAEQELAIDRNLKFVSWFAKTAWGRCKIDVTVLKTPVVAAYDWKTGNIREDSLQLKINSCFLSLKHQKAEEYVTRYIWLKHDAVTPKDGTYPASKIPELWAEIMSWVNRMEEAWETENFPPKPSGLCKRYCAVATCEFCGR